MVTAVTPAGTETAARKPTRRTGSAPAESVACQPGYPGLAGHEQRWGGERCNSNPRRVDPGAAVTTASPVAQA